MRHDRTVQSWLHAVMATCVCAVGVWAQGAEAIEGTVPYNGIADGPQPRLCTIGANTIPGTRNPGGGACTRLGGLVWELDVSGGAPHVCGRGIPGFRHFEHFGQAGLRFQAFGSFDLGLIAPPGAERLRPRRQKQNWTNYTLVTRYREGSRRASFAVTTSRLSPAILVECTGSALTLFGGPQHNWVVEKGKRRFAAEQRVPKFLAAPSGDGVRVVPAEQASRLGEGVGQWMLLWWGPRVFTSDTPDYLLATHGSREHAWSRELWRDVPVLAVFERVPGSIRPGRNGGLLARSAAGAIGKLVLMPLAGDGFPDTAGWERGLPDAVAEAAAFWAKRLRLFPTSVEESYVYEPATDTVTVRQRLAFEPVGEGGIAFAPVPPVLALAARYGFPVALPQGLTDPAYLTAIGPLVGVEARSFSYAISGMGKYIDEHLVVGKAAAACADLEKRLAEEVGGVVSAGAPLIPLVDVASTGDHGATPPWSNPGDTFLFLAQAAQLLPDAERKRVVGYLARIGKALPPDRPGWTPYATGVRRTTGKAPSAAEAAALEKAFDEHLRPDRNRLFFPAREMVPPENLYALEACLAIGGTWDLKGRWKRLFEILEPYTRRSDWASLGWFRWNENYRLADGGGVALNCMDFGTGGVGDANRWLAGLIGFVRLARRQGAATHEALGRYLFARAAALRFAMGKLPRWLHEAGRVGAPKDPKWYAKAIDLARQPADLDGYPFALDWRGPQDDIRQVVVLDEFGPSLRVALRVGSAGRLAPFRFLVPETARFLRGHLREESATFVHHTESFMPDWEVAWGDAVLGSEASAVMHGNACDLFLAKAYVLGETPQALRRWLDIPWCPVGDYYYMAKLAATIGAARGVAWGRGTAREAP